MKNPKVFSLWMFTALAITCLQTGALGQTANELANVTSGGSSVKWGVTVPNSGVTLTIAAPDGRSFTREYRAGASPEITIADRQFDKLPDGIYSYELRLRPALSATEREALKVVRGKDDDPEADRAGRRRPVLPILVQSGSFSILNGKTIVAGAVEDRRRTGKITEPQLSPSLHPDYTGERLRNHRLSLVALFDIVNPDDTIIQGSLCVGRDCVVNESFGFDTIRMKENNTRIKFDDTSTRAGFPPNDWQLTANDSVSGGASKFSIEDITGSKVPFTVTAGAATNSIFLDNTGRLGLRTSTPALDIHANTGNTPALRFEQNNSGGFTAQTWDIAGNEFNFFVRDVTAGSRLPFRIRPGAPTSSIDISASGKVGIGTGSPTAHLTINGASVDDGSTGLDFTNTAGNTFRLAAGVPGVTNSNFSISQGATPEVVILNGSGNVGIGTSSPTAHLAVSGSSVDTGSTGIDLINTAGSTFRLAAGVPGVTNSDFSISQAGTAEFVILNGNGNVGIGTPTPDQRLSVNGDANKVGGGAWLNFSDERLKTIKGRFNSGLSAVMQLQPIRYEYLRNNALGLKSEGEHIGFGAQTLQKVIPEAVTKNREGYLLVNNDPIIWTMLNAIKEQQQEIKTQQQEIAALKGEVRKLQATSRRRGK